MLHQGPPRTSFYLITSLKAHLQIQSPSRVLVVRTNIRICDGATGQPTASDRLRSYWMHLAGRLNGRYSMLPCSSHHSGGHLFHPQNQNQDKAYVLNSLNISDSVPRCETSIWLPYDKMSVLKLFGSLFFW